VYVAADRYNDPVLKDELLNRLDLHALNQQRFKLPDRVTAKRFIFKLLYGASAYGYAMDSDFIGVGFSARQWQKVIDEFYAKYKNIEKGHQKDIGFVVENGYLEVPSGRFFNYAPKKNYRGEWQWPITKIKNYPIQGFGADLVMLSRIEFFKRFKRSGLEGHFIQTIHDSIVVDTPSKNVYNIATMLKESVEATPALCKEHFGYEFSLPLLCEILVGPNKKDLTELKLD
jgi:DNA polymerase I-like protein with 3'-5' exonuclease and polymerase domains